VGKKSRKWVVAQLNVAQKGCRALEMLRRWEITQYRAQKKKIAQMM